MSDFSDKLQHFVDNVCPGDITDCENCPGTHYRGEGCHHPEHPSMKDIGVDFVKEKSKMGG